MLASSFWTVLYIKQPLSCIQYTPMVSIQLAHCTPVEEMAICCLVSTWPVMFESCVKTLTQCIKISSIHPFIHPFIHVQSGLGGNCLSRDTKMFRALPASGHLVGPQVFSRPAERPSPSSASWDFLKASFQRDIPGTPF